MGYKDIGYRIQIAREEAGLNQKELSERLGISQSTLSNYEKGKRRLYLAQLQQIAEVLGRPIEYFLQPIETTPSNSISTENRENRKDETQELLQIIGELAELPPEDRKSVIDFIKWLRYRREKGQQ